MVFSWLKRRRRRKLLTWPFPREWLPHLDALPFYNSLTDRERARLRRDLRVIVHEKSWEGCGGLAVDDEIKVTIAAQAALLLLELDHEYYRRVESILVYPSTFVGPTREGGPGSMVLSSEQPSLGLAFHGGPVVLAWDSAHHGVLNPADGRNLVLHEFAHKLDMLDGFADGTPPLGKREAYESWLETMTREFRKLGEDADKGRRTLLDVYGATRPAEFFAVATECFFEKPRPMENKHPELYGVLKAYYGQDPAART